MRGGMSPALTCTSPRSWGAGKAPPAVGAPPPITREGGVDAPESRRYWLERGGRTQPHPPSRLLAGHHPKV